MDENRRLRGESTKKGSGVLNSKGRRSTGTMKMEPEVEKEIGRDEAPGQEGARPRKVLKAHPGSL